MDASASEIDADAVLNLNGPIEIFQIGRYSSLENKEYYLKFGILRCRVLLPAHPTISRPLLS